MWAWAWATAALWLQTAGAGSRQEPKRTQQLAIRVESPNITSPNHEGLPGSFKVGACWGACGRVSTASKLRLSPYLNSSAPFLPGEEPEHCLRP